MVIWQKWHVSCVDGILPSQTMSVLKLCLPSNGILPSSWRRHTLYNCTASQLCRTPLPSPTGTPWSTCWRMPPPSLMESSWGPSRIRSPQIVEQKEKGKKRDDAPFEKQYIWTRGPTSILYSFSEQVETCLKHQRCSHCKRCSLCSHTFCPSPTMPV